MATRSTMGHKSNGHDFSVVNLSLPVEELAPALIVAFQHCGFAYATGHGLDDEMEAAFDELDRFFATSIDEKTRACSVNRALRGYSPSGSENFASLAGQVKPNDTVEKFRIGPLAQQMQCPKKYKQFYFQNAWPDDTATSKGDKGVLGNPKESESFSSSGGERLKAEDGSNRCLRPSLEALYSSLTTLSQRITAALAVGLGVPADYFEASMTSPTSILSANHYPLIPPPPLPLPTRTIAAAASAAAAATSASPAEATMPAVGGNMRVAEHTDVSLFTLVAERSRRNKPLGTSKSIVACRSGNGSSLVPGSSGGLEVLVQQQHSNESKTAEKSDPIKSDESWVPIAPLPGAIVINIGDCLQDWSGGRLVSTVHRVAPQASPTEVSGSTGRTSFAFFVSPDPGADVSPGGLVQTQRPTSLGAIGSGTSCEPLTYADWRKQRILRAMRTIKTEGPAAPTTH